MPAKTEWGYTASLLDPAGSDDISGEILTGTELSKDVALYHDGDRPVIGLRRAPDNRNGILLELPDFPATYLSLALGVPEGGVRGLGRNSLLRLALTSRTQKPFQAYARLNLKYGPNTEQIVREIDIGTGDSFAEFDIFYTGFEPSRTSGAWIDLIFNAPSGLSVQIFDVVILRRVRASL